MGLRSGIWRWIGGAAGVGALLAVAILPMWRRPPRWKVIPIYTAFPADGRERAVLRVVATGNGGITTGDIAAEMLSGQPREIRVVQAGRGLEVWMQAPVVAGVRQARLRGGGKTVTETLRFTQDDTDSFGDGMPDALRLHSAEDRAAFREWFWRLAELQAELPEEQRASEIQDCSALLRYSYREALSAHSSDWAEAQHVVDVAFQSVRQWRYPETMIGVGLFRVSPGPFLAGDESNGAFAQFADAHGLMAWNTYRVGRDLRSARPGDLIFFRQLEQNSPYHSMVITGKEAGWVVYHTGPIGRQKGEMRRMTIEDLQRHPDARWRPIAENSNFLGVFRWNLLREGD